MDGCEVDDCEVACASEKAAATMAVVAEAPQIKGDF